MPKIITFTGVSAVGKTSIAGKLIEEDLFRMLVSYTTRGPRMGDLEGEYDYLTAEEFCRKQLSFLWDAEHNGTYYGTMSEDIDSALVMQEISIMILQPKVIPKLRTYLSSVRKIDEVLSFFVKSESEDELRRRFSARGELQESIEARISKEQNWQNDALSSGVPYQIITNPRGQLDRTVELVKGYLRQSHFENYINN
jgi:guanylate kinase